MSVDLDSMKKLLEITGQYQQPKIHPALGVHPGMVKPETQQLAFDFMRAQYQAGLCHRGNRIGLLV